MRAIVVTENGGPDVLERKGSGKKVDSGAKKGQTEHGNGGGRGRAKHDD